jgi:hypothetical protein
VGFVVDKVVLAQVFSECFGFPCQSSFHQKFSLLRNTCGRYNRPEVVDVPSDSTPTMRIEKKIEEQNKLCVKSCYITASNEY